MQRRYGWRLRRLDKIADGGANTAAEARLTVILFQRSAEELLQGGGGGAGRDANEAAGSGAYDANDGALDI